MTTPLLALHIEADHSMLLGGERDPVILQVSPRRLIARHWPRGQPGPLELERAIDDIENAIEQAGLLHAARGVLHATASLRHVLPPRFGASTEYRLEEVEAEFSRLVAASGAASPDPDPATTGEAAAALLLLRELMHHLGFAAFTTQP